jgi:hypothetical protein
MKKLLRFFCEQAIGGEFSEIALRGKVTVDA